MINKLYKEARARAQSEADFTGHDYGLEYNKLLKEWTMFMLPMKKNRFGHELTCEVVHSNKPQLGHGYAQLPGAAG